MLFLFLIRPLAGLIGLLGTPAPFHEKAGIGFFGLRGVGSFHYLADAVNTAGIEKAAELWPTAAFVVLVSVVIHGITVTPAMTYIDRHRAARGQQAERRP